MKPDRRVWFAIPTANTEMAAVTLPQWQERGYSLALFVNHGYAPPVSPNLLHVGRYFGWARAVNLLCQAIVRICPEAEVVVTGGDDLYPDPDHSPGDILQDFRERFPDLCGVMQPVGDKFAGVHLAAVSPWIGRGWIIRAYLGKGPVCPEYYHYCADTELCAVAEKMGRYERRGDIHQYHLHWTRRPENERRPWDHLSVAQQMKGADRRTYEKRQADGWPRSRLL